MTASVLNRSATLEIFKVIQWLERDLALPEKPPPQKPREPGAQLVGSMSTRWDTKDVVQFLKCALHRLWDHEEDNNKRQDIQTSVETESCA